MIQQGATVGARLEKVEQGWRRVRPYLLWGLAGVVVLAGLILVLIYVPKIQVPTGYWLNPKVIFDMENEARRTLAYIIGGLLVFIGIILTFWQIRILRKQVHVAQEGQITERFTRAIEQLGSQEMAICLGGIYALERIANDSEKDYWPIIETLTAYVRDNAPWREPLPDSPVPKDKIKPATNIQAILTVLGRRKYRYKQEETKRPDLRGTDLRGADLWGAHLARASLERAHLEGASLTRSNLREARLYGAHHERAHLRKTILERADLKRASLEKANLRGANLIKAHLEGASLNQAHLEGANLLGALGLTREQLAEAIIDEKTILPDYLQEEPQEAKGPEGDKQE